MKGPEYGLGMFKKIASSMRVLVCGGDGTVGWILSTLDKNVKQHLYLHFKSFTKILISDELAEISSNWHCSTRH
ncbi:unnamed protein product [Onchocerca flexuosa]|uniref:DAGKc domain-containing protein n=1 Tax=Onchocerca flexuosa TaxID=387005 RepID=A0A183I882_9BILA|nr:unnamed protein product [Onchocerca flexuosa]